MKVIGIYNAKSGIFNGAFDYLHKTFSPSTYNCELCQFTFSSFGMRNDWKKYLESKKIEFKFYHLNDAPEKFLIFEEYPVIFLYKDEQIIPLVTKKEFSDLEDISELMNLIDSKLNTAT